MIKKIGEESFMNHFYNSYFPNHNRAFHINNLQKGVEKNLPGVEGVDFAERGRSTPKGVGVGRSDVHGCFAAESKLACCRWPYTLRARK